MFQTIHVTQKTSNGPTMLRCVWVPSHTGANATLTAVWIETPQTPALAQTPTREDASEADWRPKAA